MASAGLLVTSCIANVFDGVEVISGSHAAAAISGDLYACSRKAVQASGRTDVQSVLKGNEEEESKPSCVAAHTEKGVRPHLRPRRPLVFSGFSVGIGQEIRHGCQFLHSLFRALGHLPGGLSRFIPCQPSAHYARLSHLGWGRCGHGLSSRPRESCVVIISFSLPFLISLVIRYRAF